MKKTNSLSLKIPEFSILKRMNRLTKYACILTVIAGGMACSGGEKAQGDYAIIPLPQEVATQGSAPFLLKPSTPISYKEGDTEMEQTARFLASYIKEATGYEPKVGTGNADKGIHLSIASDIRNPEGYRLLVSENGIEIAGASNAGIFYGVQTLRKALPAVAEGMVLSSNKMKGSQPNMFEIRSKISYGTSLVPPS